MNSRKGWKALPHSLKGALLGGGAFIGLFMLVFFVIPAILPSKNVPPLGLAMVLLLPGLVFFRVFGLDLSGPLTPWWLAALSLPVYVCAGAALGWAARGHRAKERRTP